MSDDSGFNALPNELYHLIGSYAFGTSTICALTRVSKCLYETFNPILYKKIDTSALSTVASTESARLPLTGPHPATFVRSMVFEFPFDCDNLMYITRTGFDLKDETRKRVNAIAPSELAIFQKLATSAVSNVISYAPHAAVEALEYRCTHSSLADTFQNIDFSVFSSLKSLIIACPFPIKNLQQSLAIIVSTFSTLGTDQKQIP